MIGTAVAGVLIASSGASACFLVNAASYLVVLASLLALRRDEIVDRRVAGAQVRIRDGLAHVRERPVLRRTLLTTAAVGLLCMNFMILVPAMVKLAFDAEASWFGLAEVFSGAGSTVAGFIAGALHRPTTRTVGLSAVAIGAATVVTGLAPSLVVFCVLMFAVGLAATGFMTTSMTVVQAAADPEMRGRVAALLVMANQGTTPVGALVMGVLMSTIGVRTAMVGAGASATRPSRRHRTHGRTRCRRRRGRRQLTERATSR
jgi:predicted MFS family arabinose efflux permease